MVDYPSLQNENRGSFDFSDFACLSPSVYPSTVVPAYVLTVVFQMLKTGRLTELPFIDKLAGPFMPLAGIVAMILLSDTLWIVAGLPLNDNFTAEGSCQNQFH